MTANPTTQAAVERLSLDLLGELDGVISDLESSGWARAPQCIKTLRRVAAALPPSPSVQAHVDRLVKEATDLLNAYSAYFPPGNPWGDRTRAALAPFADRVAREDEPQTAASEIGGLCDNCSTWFGGLRKNVEGEWLCGPCRTTKEDWSVAPPPEQA